MFDKQNRATTELIERYLDRFGWKGHVAVDEPAEERGIVATGWSRSRGSDEQFVLMIDPRSEKSVLTFRVGDILRAGQDETPAERFGQLLLGLGGINYRLIMGAFAYDPSDGEVIFKLTIPIDSDDLEYDEFEHCLNAVVSSVERRAPDLRAIVDGTKTAQDVLS